MWYLRLALNILLWGGVVVAPVWFVALVALILLIRFRAIEVIFAGMLYDILYAAPVPNLLYYQFLFTSITLVAFITTEYVKRQISVYTTLR